MFDLENKSEAARLIVHGAGSPAWNMAVDEALLRDAASLGLPTLRVYEWDRPALSIGYFQAGADAGKAAPGVEFVRRYTGGGLVDHRQDVTYTMVLPPGHDWLQLAAPDSYKRVHEGVVATLQAIGVNAELTRDCDALDSNACFEKAVRYDAKLLNPDGTSGAKVAGAAQRRTRAGLLQQGSILLPDPDQNNELRLTLPVIMAQIFGMQWRTVEPEDLDSGERLTAAELVLQRYGTEEWNGGR